MSPDRRQHRGAHPFDEELFDTRIHQTLRTATYELSWLLSRGYTLKGSLKLVGDRHSLRERQRLAIARAACSDNSRERRKATRLDVASMAGESLIIDGFNLIITLEAALSGGVLIRCRDDCIRDLSSVHGSYRSVLETERALLLIGEALETMGPNSARWLLDSPVSNSGRLASRIGAIAGERGWRWSVETLFNPDAEIVSSTDIALTSDSNVLDGAARWMNFAGYLVETRLPEAWVIDLRV